MVIGLIPAPVLAVLSSVAAEVAVTVKFVVLTGREDAPCYLAWFQRILVAQGVLCRPKRVVRRSASFRVVLVAFGQVLMPLVIGLNSIDANFAVLSASGIILGPEL